MKVDSWANNAFKNMENLRVLIVRNTIFSKGPTYLPNELRIIDWKGYPSKSFPPDFNPHRIVDFNLGYSSLVLKKSFQTFKDLTFINLSQCQYVTQIPDVSGAENLTVLTLDRCQKLKRFHKSVGILRKLVYLSASECNALKIFVKEMYLPSLEVLSFNFCRRLEHFPTVRGQMSKPLKIHMINTAIEKFPETIDNLTGLEYIDMSTSRKLKDIPSSFLLLPKLVTLKLDGCSQLGGSFGRLKENHSAANDSLMTLSLSETNLSYEDLCVILEIFPKLEDLNVSYNGFVSLPECIDGSQHLKSLDVSYCRNLTVISGLPSSIQKVDATYCRCLTSETSSMLWSKVKEMKRIQVVMPKTEIPEWFSPVRNEEIPYFWARLKCPAVAFAFMFEEDEIKMKALNIPNWMISDQSSSISLRLFIGGVEINCKEYHFRVRKDDVLFGDLRVLFDVKEWQDLNGYLGDNWKAIQVKCDSRTLTLCNWGVYVYNQEKEKDYIQFMRSHPHTSREYLPPTNLVAESSQQLVTQDLRHTIEKFIPGDILDSVLPMIKLGEGPSLPKLLMRSFRNAKAGIGGRVLVASAYGASLKQESGFNLVEMSESVRENVPEHIDGSGHQFIDEAFRAESELTNEKYWWMLETDMPIILEGCHFNETPTRRFWGNLELKGGELAEHALMSARGRNLQRVRLWEKNYFRGVVLLKCPGPSIEEDFRSSNEETLEEQYLHPGLQELLRKIEEDAMSFNHSYGG